jgi:hypothetical protein
MPPLTAADVALAPVLTPEASPVSIQLNTRHQRCQEIFTGNEGLLGSLTPEQANAITGAYSKLGRFSLTTMPFQPSLRSTDLQVAAALQLLTWLADGRPTAPTAVWQTSSGTPRSAVRESHGV